MSVVHRRDDLGIDIEGDGRNAHIRQRDREWQPNVSTATDYRNSHDRDSFMRAGEEWPKGTPSAGTQPTEAGPSSLHCRSTRRIGPGGRYPSGMARATVAVIPTFRPSPDEVPSLVSSLLEQSLDVMVADDASPCTSDTVLRDIASMGATVVRHRRNAGIARSLNDGLALARARGAEWLLTVDQDSTLPDGYVAALLSSADSAIARVGASAVGAVAAGSIDDASGGLDYPVTSVSGLATTQEVIQTGTLWSVAGLIEVGGFDESFRIDAVDAAASVRLRAHGRHLMLAQGLTLAHQVGSGRQVRVLGRSVLASGHSPERRTSIVRNRLRLFPAEFAQSPTHALRTLRRVAVNTALAITVEDDRWAKAKGSARGLLPRRQR